MGKKKNYSKKAGSSAKLPVGVGPGVNIELLIKSKVSSAIRPFEDKISSLVNRIENVRANLVVALHFLEKKGIFTREEFLEEYGSFCSNEIGVVNGDGSMNGSAMFTLYNVCERGAL